MSGYTMADFEVTVDAETGHRIMKFATDSNMLPVEQPDMYHTYNGDWWTERFLENMEEDGQPSDYDDYDWEYDSSAACMKLSQAGAQDVVDQLSAWGIIRSVEVTSTWSPREYNFTTDSYKATWEFDADKLDEWAAENNFNAAEYVKQYHSSYSGFMSFVEDWIEDERYIEGTTQWLKLAAYLRAELDENQQRIAMQEVEDEAWDETTVITRKTED